MFIAVSNGTRLDYLLHIISIEEIRIVGAENMDRPDPKDPGQPGIDYFIEVLKTDGTRKRITPIYSDPDQILDKLRELTEALQDRDLIINVLI